MPNEILFSKKLSQNAKVLFVYLSSLCAEKGYCRATNGHFAISFDRSERSIQRDIHDLAKCGYVIVDVSKDGRRKIYLGQGTQPEGGDDKSVVGVGQDGQGGDDKSVVHNNINIITQDNNLSDDKGSDGSDETKKIVSDQEISEEETPPPTPAPNPPKLKKQPNPEITTCIDGIKMVLAKFEMVYKPVSYKTDKGKTITDRHLIGSLLKTNALIETAEKHSITPGKLIVGLVVWSFRNEFWRGKFCDAKQIQSSRHKIYNDYVANKQTTQVSNTPSY